VRGEETIFTHLERTCYASDGVPKPDHYATDALFRIAAAAGARLVMDGHAGDATLNPRGGSALAYFLREGELRRFARELRAAVRLSGQPAGRVLMSSVVPRMAPPTARRAWRAVKRGFKPLWADSGIAPELAQRLLASGTLETRDILGWTWDNPLMRELLLLSLHAWTGWYRTGESKEAASHGLELSRPLADRRCAEFGLAIPEDLYVKDGVHRYPATRSLADVYPVEFQTRRPRQDVLDPAVNEMFCSIHPRLKSELERMAMRPELQRYFDFDVLKKNLGEEPGTYATSRFELHTFLTAAYVAWFMDEG
jgi:asparagine synthase (glutamine-hydrolysing)